MAYTIQKGDTLSQLAQKYGTTTQNLMSLNPQIKDPNLIYAGASLNLPEAPKTPIAPTTPISAPYQAPTTPITTPEIPTAQFNIRQVSPEATSATLTQPKFDYTSLLGEQKKFREDYLKSLQPTVAETDINKQIADIRGQAEQQRLAAQKEQVSIEQAGMQRGAETRFVRGEQALAGRQRELEYQTLAANEANLLSRLGLEQESRKAQQQALQTGMSFIQQDIETQQKIQDRLQAEEDRVLTRANTLRDDARAVLSTILTQFSGMDISDLSPEVQSQLAQTATKAGIPLDVLTAGMKSVKDNIDFKRSMEMAEFGLKEESLSLREQLAQQKLETAKAKADSIGGDINEEGKIVPQTPAQAQKINKELVTNDAYKAVRKGQDSLQFLLDFEKAFNKYGLETLPGKGKGELKTSYQTTMLNLKEFFNLGVLNGPDLVVLQGIIPDPTTGFFKKFRGRKSAVSSGIENMKRNIEKSLDERFQSLNAQYGQYSDIDVSSLNDLKRIYIKQKSTLNPKFNQLIKDNPDLSYDDIISIIQ